MLSTGTWWMFLEYIKQLGTSRDDVSNDQTCAYLLSIGDYTTQSFRNCNEISVPINQPVFHGMSFTGFVAFAHMRKCLWRFKMGPYNRYKWSYNSYKWPQKWIAWVIYFTPYKSTTGVMGPYFITAFGAHFARTVRKIPSAVPLAL